MIPDLIHILYLTILTTAVWFAVGGILYMNPLVAKVYRGFQNHPSVKTWKLQSRYLLGVFCIAGLIPIFFIAVVFEFIQPVNWILFGFLLCGVRIIPRCCDMWMETSYPNRLLLIELINGVILSVVIALMFSVL